jgi:hypothetical protein
MHMLRIVVAGLAAGLIMLVIGGAMDVGVRRLLPTIAEQYQHAPFASLKGWRTIYMVVHPLWFGFLLAALYALFRSACGPARPSTVWTGALFGLLLSLGGAWPVFALNHASFPLPPSIAVAWALQNALQYAAAGAVVGAILQTP